MNYLAHLYLSGSNKEIRTGNFIADAVKGKRYEDFSDDIQKGILLHRKIDRYTDTHPLFIQSKQKLNTQYTYFSGIIIDIFYDHFLSKYWSHHSRIPFDHFLHDNYNLMLSQYAILPKQMQYFLPYMVKNNWLKMYGELNGVERVLKGLSKRTALPEKTSFAMQILNAHYTEFREEFELFFADIKQFIVVDEKINLKIHI